MVHTLHFQDNFRDNAFPVDIRRMRNHRPTALHAHEFLELVVVLGGRAQHFNHADAYDLAPGDVFVVHPGEAHGYRDTAHLDLYNVLLRDFPHGDAVRRLNRLPGYQALFSLEPIYRNRHGFGCRLRLAAADLQHVRAHIERIRIEVENREPGSALLVQSLVIELLILLTRLYARNPSRQSRAVLDVETALRFMQARLAQPISLQDIATETGLSVSTLLRRFRSVAGRSPMDMLIEMRVEEARLRLENTDLSVGEISDTCGFSDSNYFARQFRARTGMAPSRFRRHRNHQTAVSAAP